MMRPVPTTNVRTIGHCLRMDGVAMAHANEDSADLGAHLIISSPSRHDVVEGLEKDPNLLGLYQVCGRSQWLLIWDLPTTGQGLPLTKQYGLSARFLSLAPKRHRTLLGDRIPDHDVTTWFFLAGADHAVDDLIRDVIAHDRDRLSPLIRYDSVIGEYPTILKVAALDVSAVEHFLDRCADLNIDASTKCVLETKKNEGPDPQMGRTLTALQRLARDPEYAAARIMANRLGLLAMGTDNQRVELKRGLKNLGCSDDEATLKRLVLNVDDDCATCQFDDLVHKNSLVERYSVVLERPGWLRTLVQVKVKASLKQTLKQARAKVQQLLEMDFLGVSERHFARKIYHMTGSFDFLIPFDCLDLSELDTVIERFHAKHPHLIETLIVTLCKPSPGEAAAMSPVDVQIVNALLTNSTGISEFERRLKDRLKETVRSASADDPLKAMEVPPEHEEGVAPREDRVRIGLRDVPPDARAHFLKEFKSLKAIGIRPVPEFSNTKLFRTLVRFELAEVSKQALLLSSIKKKMQAHSLIARIYQPVRDLSSILAIVVASDLRELRSLFEDLKSECRRIEFHMLFHETRYANPLPTELACKPCIQPQASFRDANSRPCSTCINYVLPRLRKRIVSLPSPSGPVGRDARVAVLGIKLTLAQYFMSEEYFDISARRQEVFKRYEEYLDSITSEDIRASVESADQITKEFRAGPTPAEFRHSYYAAVLGQVERLVKDSEGPDLVVLPEYSVPRVLAERIIAMRSKRPVIIIAGSHLYQGYNVCPVVFLGPHPTELYPLYKVYQNPFETRLKTMTHRGTSSLRFDDSPLGNLLVQLCYDGFKLQRHPEVDVFAVPSWNHSKEFVKNFADAAGTLKALVAYANTQSTEAVGSRILIPPDHARRAGLLDVQPRRPASPVEVTKDDLFSIGAPETITVGEHGHEFRLHMIRYDPMQLDARRRIRTRNEA